MEKLSWVRAGEGQGSCSSQRLHRSPTPGRRRVKALFIHDQATGICTGLNC